MAADASDRPGEAGAEETRRVVRKFPWMQLTPLLSAPTALLAGLALRGHPRLRLPVVLTILGGFFVAGVTLSGEDDKEDG